jgi:SAM-dependent methyltransferase
VAPQKWILHTTKDQEAAVIHRNTRQASQAARGCEKPSCEMRFLFLRRVTSVCLRIPDNSMSANDRPAADVPAEDPEVAEQAALMEEDANERSPPLHRKWVAALYHVLSSAYRRAEPVIVFIGLPSFEQCMVSTLRNLFVIMVILLIEFLAFKLGLRGDTRNPLAHDLMDLLKYWMTGVSETEMDAPDAEAETYAMYMGLKPGMTICEMGAADGSLMVLLGRHVMPGGQLIATAPNHGELAATSRAVEAAGLPGVRTYLATRTEWAPGLPPQTCDAIYSRMVIHMINIHIVRRYVPQLAAALKPGGRMFMTDHNPLDGGRDGPSRPIEWKFGILPMMYVLPENTEVSEMTAGGHLRVLDGPFVYPYFGGGYGVVYTTTVPVTTNAHSSSGRELQQEEQGRDSAGVERDAW